MLTSFDIHPVLPFGPVLCEFFSGSQAMGLTEITLIYSYERKWNRDADRETERERQCSWVFHISNSTV